MPMKFSSPSFPLKFFALLVLFVSSLGLPASANETGNNAWVITSTQLFSGPGVRYGQTTSFADQGQAVTIARCTGRWCRLANTDNWISMDNLSFGQTPTNPFSGPKFNFHGQGDGEVCLYSGENYSGDVLCLSSGAVARDLSLLGIDNTFASVSINGEVSINLCRDRNFSSLCQRFDQSTPRLSRLLVRAVSSYQVY